MGGRVCVLSSRPAAPGCAASPAPPPGPAAAPPPPGTRTSALTQQAAVAPGLGRCRGLGACSRACVPHPPGPSLWVGALAPPGLPPGTESSRAPAAWPPGPTPPRGCAPPPRPPCLGSSSREHRRRLTGLPAFRGAPSPPACRSPCPNPPLCIPPSCSLPLSDASHGTAGGRGVGGCPGTIFKLHSVLSLYRTHLVQNDYFFDSFWGWVLFPPLNQKFHEPQTTLLRPLHAGHPQWGGA